MNCIEVLPSIYSQSSYEIPDDLLILKFKNQAKFLFWEHLTFFLYTLNQCKVKLTEGYRTTLEPHILSD